LFGRLGVGVGNENLFAAAGLAGDQFEAGGGEAQLFGQELEAHLVGLVVRGRGGDADFEGIVVEAGDLVFGGFGLYVDVDQQTV